MLPNAAGGTKESATVASFQCVVIDKDSTLADTRQRRHAIPADRSGRANWTRYAALCGDDEPVPGVVTLVRALAPHYVIIILTGADDTPPVQEATKAWLAKHSIPYHMIYHQPVSDDRDASAWKAEMIESLRWSGFHTFLVIDDWYKTGEALQGSGVPLLQVSPPGGPNTLLNSEKTEEPAAL